MSDRRREILNCLERMDFHGEANPQLATELAGTVGMFADNKNNIARLHQAGITSDTSSAAGRSGTRSKVARSRSIHSDLRRVARTAKLIEKKAPDFENTFDMRGGTLGYQELIDKADGFIEKRAKHQIHFTKYGLTEAFFAELRADADELREITRGQADARRTSVGTTADTEAILEDSLDTRGELKIALENHYKDNPARLAEWLSASRIERSRRTEAKTDAPP
ncbi:MAG: hypothetical protein WA584_09645 [Pyrinomonadaceae bacterium]